MVNKYLKKSLFVILFLGLSFGLKAQKRPAATPFMAGSEIRIKRLVGDIVEYEVIYYRNCAATPGFGGKNKTQGDPILVIIQSEKCCEIIIDTARLDTLRSEKNATPLCPYDPAVTRCDTSLTTNTGYKTETYVGRVALKCPANDWRFGHLFSSTLAFQNFLPSSSQPPGSGPISNQLPPPLLRPANQFVCRMQGSNTLSQQSDGTEAFFYIEAKKYSNDLKDGVDNTVVPPKQLYKSNTTPRSAANPLVFQCLGVDREYDLGYFDVDGHTLKFYPMTPYKDAPSSFSTDGVPLTWASTANGNCNEANPLCGSSIYNIDENTGVLTIRADAGVGFYKTAIRIVEWDGPRVIGITMRDIVITIQNTPNCGDINSVASVGRFLPGFKNLKNCAVVPNRIRTVEACAGTNISFDVAAMSTSPYVGASLRITGEFSSELDKIGAFVSDSQIARTFPKFDTTYGRVHINFPPNFPAGTYYVIFQIRDCIDGYILSRTEVVNIRVNSPTVIKWNYKNTLLDPKIITLSSTRAYSCSGSPEIRLYADNGQKDAIFTWQSTGSSNYNVYDDESKINSICEMANGSSGKMIVISNQYCNNTETIDIISKPDIVQTVDTIIKRAFLNPEYTICRKDTITFDIKPKINGFLYDWQYDKSPYREKTIPILDTVTSLLLFPTNNYTVYIISPDTCIVPFSYKVEISGIRPTTSFITDKKYVCPKDTISVFPFYTTAICGKDQFNVPTGALKTLNFPGTESTTSPVPKVFASADTIIHMKTQFLYKASELIKNNFKPGLVREIGLYIDGVSTPNFYSNLKIKVSCTDKDNLDDLQFININKEVDSTTLYNINLSKGWNYFNLGAGFSWDGTYNLIFEFEAKCIKPDPGSQAIAPAFLENTTNYVSVIGRYGVNLNKFQSNPIVGSNYRPNLSWKYYNIKDSRIKFKWTTAYIRDDTDTSNPNTIFSDTIPNPKFSTKFKRWYNVEVKDSICITKDSVLADVNEEYKIYMRDSVKKCPSDTIQLLANPGMVSKRPFKYFCGIDESTALFKLYGFDIKSEDTCRSIDSIYYPYFGSISSTTADGLVSPFGGSTSTAGSPTTDKRVQLLYTKAELKALTGMPKGIISELRFDIKDKFVNLDSINNFSIKMKCIADTMDQFSANNSFHSAATFTEVYYAKTLPGNTIGPNYFKLSKPFGWDGTTGIMIDICYDNITGTPYYSETVLTFNTPTKMRALYRATNTAATSTTPEYGCTFTTGTRSTIRPNLGFVICAPTTPFPPIPKFFEWVPTTYISNTKIKNPIVYNESTTKYFVLLDYIDTNLGKNKFVCRIDDRFFSEVSRPKIEFEPKEVASCANNPTTMTATVSGLPSSLYDFQWTASQGLDPLNLDNPKQKVIPPNPKYYYVKVSSKDKPNCWSKDSVFVSIQQLRAMPDLGGAVQLCNGDSALLTIPTGLGYRNPLWMFNGNPIDTGFVLKIGQEGSYNVLVDSGACRNTSALKQVTYRIPKEATLKQKDFKVCQGDTVVIIYNLEDGVTVPLWNNGVVTVANKVTENGQYFLIKSKDQYGCDMKVRDTATVDVISNPDFVIQNDTICLGANQKKKLIPDPLDPSASYTWSPTGETTASIDVVKPGKYTVTRKNLNCLKTASAVVIEEFFGTLDLGANQAICCDEILTLDANPTGKKYKSYKWSTGATSQSIYTVPNASGTYVAEAFKASGCKDTGSVYIDSKCADVKAYVEKESIQLGETNQIITKHLDVNASKITYKWMSTQDYNRIINGDKENPIAKPMDTGDAEYVLIMTVEDSMYMPPKPFCVENTVVRFKIKPNGVKNYNVITPNHDGVNDTYFPVITGNVTIKEFKVYNRQGLLIYSSKDTPWDGNYNGSPQPTGVYVCLISYEIVEPKNEPVTKFTQINLTLIR